MLVLSICRTDISWRAQQLQTIEIGNVRFRFSESEVVGTYRKAGKQTIPCQIADPEVKL
jgi:hypothetical protein